MSGAYALEPTTHGRIELETTHGSIGVNLYSRECPQACRSIIQHALNRYYDNIYWHRIVKDVLIQTGNPDFRNDGKEDGGRAASKSGFIPREIHGRLKFRRRGMVALVADESAQCRSQFFITLAPAPWLDGMHTIFGSVDGNTIFNALNIGNAEAAPGNDGEDLELMPKLISVRVVESPFEDIKPTALEVDGNKSMQSAFVKGKNNEGAKKKSRNSATLSFARGDDDDSESDEGTQLLTNSPTRRRILQQKRIVQPAPSASTHAPPAKPPPVSARASAPASAPSAQFAALRATALARVKAAKERKAASSTKGDGIGASAGATAASGDSTNQPSSESNRGASPMSVDGAGSTLTTAKKKRSAAQAQLARLAEFEKRLIRARNEAAANVNNNSKISLQSGTQRSIPFFARPLQLASSARSGSRDVHVDDVNDYEVRDPLVMRDRSMR